MDEPPVATTPPRQRRRASESSFVVVALAGIVAVAILVVVAFTLSNDEGSGDGANLGGGGQAPAQTGETSSGGGSEAPTTQKLPAATARLVLTAARGPCWVEVHRNTADGELLFAGTIERGRSMRFTGKRLWLVFGTAPSENLDARLNGRRVANFPAGEEIVVVSARGVRAEA